MPLITLTLVGAIYPSQLVDNIKDMLSKPELTKDLTWNMHLYNLKIVIGILTYHIWDPSLQIGGKVFRISLVYRSQITPK